ncbi:MAG: endonuclease/exonuclease/phosphatase family metal-dependent hydrolase [Pirellulaceae bacterium]|jgi:endonuclease/exonuclease/phosphatase family metal-dependent hydrolase
MNQLSVGVFCADNQKWRTKADAGHEFSTQTLMFATYNIWFGRFGRFGRHRERDRHLAILTILQNRNADVIGLQEVTHSSLPLILEQEWIRDAYEVSDSRGDTFGAYGTLLLSRLPVLNFEQTLCVR